MFLYVLIEDIKTYLKLFNNTHNFEPNILETQSSRMPSTASSGSGYAEDGKEFLRNIRFPNKSN